jgi:hypothetical protein
MAFVYLMASIAVSTSIQESEALQSCSEIYKDSGWIIDECDDSKVKDVMEVAAGAINASAAYLHIHHRSQNGSYPEVAAIYASGYVRLKQNDPSIPYGSSFILGPAYWPNYTILHNNPQINRLEIDTTQLPSGPLLMNAKGTSNGFDVTYDMMLPPPQDRETRLHVNQSYRANANLSIDPIRRSEHQGFKVVQFSSMFINEGGICEASHTDCHDGNAASYKGKDPDPQLVYFKDLVLPGFVFSAPQPLGSPWLDLLHTDDSSWQGNMRCRLSLNSLNINITS